MTDTQLKWFKNKIDKTIKHNTIYNSISEFICFFSGSDKRHVLDYLLQREVDDRGWIYYFIARFYLGIHDDKVNYTYYLIKSMELNNIESRYEYKYPRCDLEVDEAIKLINLNDITTKMSSVLGYIYLSIDRDKSYYYYKKAWLSGCKVSETQLKGMFADKLMDEVKLHNRIDKLDLGSLLYYDIKRYM